MTVSYSKSVCVIIPTFRRKEGLLAAMQSIAQQSGLEKVELSLIVCDNSPEASARSQTEAFAKNCAFNVRYIHEPKTGVANARNAAIKSMTGEFIAFLDDDEVAIDDWLSQMLRVQDELNADIVFGSVRARIPNEVRHYRQFLTSFFSRLGSDKSNLISDYYGCGNSLIRRACLPQVEEVFSVERNNIGGEDDLLFSTLQSEGCVMAWCGEAFVYEDVPLARASLRYTLLRAFAYGQGPSQSAASSGLPLKCALWMAQGLIQGPIFGVIGLALYLIRAPKAADMLDKSVRGFGKFLWFSPFKIHFYGTAMLKKNAKGR